MQKIFHHPVVRKHASQGLRFAVSGGIGAAINLLSLSVFVSFFHLAHPVAFLAANLLSVIFVFFANKYFTFRDQSGDHGSQAIKFIAVYGPAIVFNTLLASGLHALGMHYFIAELIAIVIVTVWNYILSHGFIFRQRAGDGSSSR